VSLDAVVIANNLAADDGGAIAAYGDVEITDSVVRNNESSGAIIDHDSGTLTIRRTTFVGNGSNHGIVRTHGGGSALIDRVLFDSNQLGLAASGIAIMLGRDATDTTSMLIRNSTFTGHSGAGVVIGVQTANTLDIRSSTIAGNSAPAITASAGTTIKNSILASNSGGNCEDMSPVSLGYNLDSGNNCGFNATGDITNGDAKLGSLRDNGGPTDTMALGSGSDAIDAGSDCPSFDQRGVSRPKDGDSDGNAVCDIGALEAAKGTTPAAPTAAPTPAPTPAPTAEITPEPTPELTAEPSAEASEEAPSAIPSASNDTATPVPSGTDAPAGGTGGPDLAILIVLGVLALMVVVGVPFAMGRRSARRSDATGPTDSAGGGGAEPPTIG
jgi:predicted outer membrane repeat protein